MCNLGCNGVLQAPPLGSSATRCSLTAKSIQGRTCGSTCFRCSSPAPPLRSTATHLKHPSQLHSPGATHSPWLLVATHKPSPASCHPLHLACLQPLIILDCLWLLTQACAVKFHGHVRASCARPGAPVGRTVGAARGVDLLRGLLDYAWDLVSARRNTNTGTNMNPTVLCLGLGECGL